MVACSLVSLSFDKRVKETGCGHRTKFTRPLRDWFSANPEIIVKQTVQKNGKVDLLSYIFLLAASARRAIIVWQTRTFWFYWFPI